jgi:tRNA pseudouridine38-40 synthase
MRIALGLEYAGTAYTGWQSQPDGRGVQDALERALGEIAGIPIRTIAAGRTDAGVHATSQVVHFDSDVVRPGTAWVRGVNSHLPPDVAVLWSAEVAADFHARFAATARHYTYVLANRPVRTALLAGRAGWYHRPLAAAEMAEAAQALVGRHDFSSFRSSECQAKSPIKTISRAAVAADGELIRFDFSADAFLHHMIRNIVGALIDVGAGKSPPAWIAELLAARDRTKGPPTFGAEGLYLAGADYATGWGLPPARRPVVLPSA